VDDGETRQIRNIVNRHGGASSFLRSRFGTHSLDILSVSIAGTEMWRGRRAYVQRPAVRARRTAIRFKMGVLRPADSLSWKAFSFAEMAGTGTLEREPIRHRERVDGTEGD